MTDTSGVTQYSYDVLDRLGSVTYPATPTTTAYTYDGVGNRLTQQVDANPATVQTYDEADQLKTIDGVTNTFDLNGSLQTIGLGNNLPNTFLYDQAERLFRTGPCRADVNDDGKVNSSDLNIVANLHAGNQGSTKYDLSSDLNGDLKINSTDLAITQTESNKNCKGSSGNGRSWYDGDGLRVRQRTFLTGGASVVNDDYVWDAGAGLPVVLQDVRTPPAGSAMATTYLYGLGLISSTDSGGVTSYTLADGLGSTTQLTDSTGAVTDSYSYDVFGSPRTTTGTTANDFRYAGEQRDGNANRGLYFLRARSYDPTLGRFLQKDPLPLVNRYAYAGNNAANLTDPSGLLPCPGCDKIRHAARTADKFLSTNGIALSKRLNELALNIDLAAATAVDTVTGGCVGAAAITGVGLAACPVVYAGGVVISLPVIIASNVISVASTTLSCYGGLRKPNDKETGVSFSDIKNCGVSAAFSLGGLFVVDPNVSALLNGYTVCRDRGRCTIP